MAKSLDTVKVLISSCNFSLFKGYRQSPKIEVGKVKVFSKLGTNCYTSVIKSNYFNTLKFLSSTFVYPKYNSKDSNLNFNISPVKIYLDADLYKQQAVKKNIGKAGVYG